MLVQLTDSVSSGLFDLRWWLLPLVVLLVSILWILFRIAIYRK